MFLTAKFWYTLPLLSRFLGGVAIQWPIQWHRSARAGAVALGAIYLTFALLWVPRIAAEPLVYDRWGNFFEQFSQVAGALIVYAAFSRNTYSVRAKTLARIGYISFGICVVSFTLEQLLYLSGTASFVPKWIPPVKMFWAIVTTIAFALAAIALLSGMFGPSSGPISDSDDHRLRIADLAAIVFADPHKLINWAGNAENIFNRRGGVDCHQFSKPKSLRLSRNPNQLVTSVTTLFHIRELRSRARTRVSAPMLYKTLSAAVYGIDANIIEVEVDISGVKMTEDHFHTVGLPDAAVRESRDRVRAALKNCGYDIPPDSDHHQSRPRRYSQRRFRLRLPMALGILGAYGA